MSEHLSGRRLCIAPEVMMRELEGEAILLNLQSSHYFGLDEVGTQMWKALTTAESVEVACATLLAEYDVEAEQLHQDVEAFIAKLVQHGLAAIEATSA